MTDKKERNEVHLPWIEKHRPVTLADVVGQNEMVSKIRTLLAKGAELPNLLLYGPPGTGKTSLLLCVAHQMFPSFDDFSSAVLVINASDDRGLTTVTDRIRTFSERKLSFLQPGQKRLVILDELYSMTLLGQSALSYFLSSVDPSRIGFLSSCNDVKNIAETVKSQSLQFGFQPLQDHDIRLRLMQVIAKEQIKAFTAKGLDTVIALCNGDLRQAISTLQLAWMGHSRVDEDVVYTVASRASLAVLHRILLACVRDDLMTAMTAAKIPVIQEHSIPDIFQSLQWAAVELAGLPRKVHAQMIMEIGHTLLTRSTSGAWSWLQVDGLLARLCEHCRKFTADLKAKEASQHQSE